MFFRVFFKEYFMKINTSWLLFLPQGHPRDQTFKQFFKISHIYCLCVLYFFLCIDLWADYFLSISWTSFWISWKESLLLMNYLSLCFLSLFLFCLYFWRVLFLDIEFFAAFFFLLASWICHLLLSGLHCFWWVVFLFCAFKIFCP